MAEYSDNNKPSEREPHGYAFEPEYYDEAAQTTVGYHAMHYENLFPEMAGGQKFAEFMLSDEAIGLVRSRQVRCLADALAHWMMHGSATLVCPTYESYLRAILHIIEYWMGEAGWVDGTYDPSYGRSAPEHYRYDEKTGIAAYGDAGHQVSTFIVVPTLVRPGTRVQIWNHPALSKEAFEFARHRRLLGNPGERHTSFYLD